MIPPEIAQMPDASALIEFDAEALLGGKHDRGELTLLIDQSRIFSVCESLKTARQYRYLSDITALDWYPAEPRFEVVYHLYCHQNKQRLRLKAKLSGEKPEIASVVPVWGAANW